MNKYMFFMLLTAFLCFMVIMVHYAELQTYDIDPGVVAPEISLFRIFDILGTFWRLMTFRVEIFPWFLTVFVFYPITFTFFYIIVDILKDLIPYT